MHERPIFWVMYSSVQLYRNANNSETKQVAGDRKQNVRNFESKSNL